CRGLNVLLGMSQAPNFGGPAAWLVAGSMALFVAGITWISRSETVVGQNRGVIAGMILQDAAIVGLIVAARQAAMFPIPSTTQDRWLSVGPVVFFLVTYLVNRADLRAIRQPEPVTLQRAVKVGVLS